MRRRKKSPLEPEENGETEGDVANPLFPADPSCIPPACAVVIFTVKPADPARIPPACVVDIFTDTVNQLIQHAYRQPAP